MKKLLAAAFTLAAITGTLCTVAHRPGALLSTSPFPTVSKPVQTPYTGWMKTLLKCYHLPVTTIPVTRSLPC